MNADQLARMVELEPMHVHDLESGKAIMNIDELFIFSEFFDCPVSDFFIGLYDFGKHNEDFIAGVTDEFFEKYLLTYFRKIPDPLMKRLMCSIVRQTAEMDKEK
ncbi:MAG: helix-turn-helix transcriptional regulator [Alphaproteobacteria bacterium]|nr:helix-turn-helix transcriptional regulator [Alphaproteobacteria bacterium]